MEMLVTKTSVFRVSRGQIHNSFDVLVEAWGPYDSVARLSR